MEQLFPFSAAVLLLLLILQGQGVAAKIYPSYSQEKCETNEYYVDPSGTYFVCSSFKPKGYPNYAVNNPSYPTRTSYSANSGYPTRPRYPTYSSYSVHPDNPMSARTLKPDMDYEGNQLLDSTERHQPPMTPADTLGCGKADNQLSYDDKRGVIKGIDLRSWNVQTVSASIMFSPSSHQTDDNSQPKKKPHKERDLPSVMLSKVTQPPK